MHKRITIKTLLKSDCKKKTIAEQIGCHRNTVRNIGKEAPLKDCPTSSGRSHPLDPYQDIIKTYLQQKLSIVRIHEKLQEEHGLKGKYDSVRKYIKTRNLKSQKAYTVLHSQPGEEAQVDFGHTGLQPDATGKKRKSYVFCMSLSYSRKSYQEVVFDQKVSTFIECHINAFEYFGGVPGQVKIDNLKSAILEADFYEPAYQKEYLEFSEAYGFQIHACKVRYPEEKGKVESGVKYVKGNFFAGRKFTTFQELEKKLSEWQENKCNRRIHGTTKKVPNIVFNEEEKQALKPLPAKRYQTYSSEKRKVSKTCHILIDGNYCSVPYKYISQEVEIRISKKLIRIYADNTQIGIHARLFTKGNYQTDKNHYPEYKVKDSTKLRQEKENKMKEIGPASLKFYQKLLVAHPTSWNRRVSGIIHLTKLYGKEAVNLSCQRALEFEVYTYQVVKKICQKKLYLSPTEHTSKQFSQNKNHHIRESPIARPISYYAQIILNFFLIIWNLLLNLQI